MSLMLCLFLGAAPDAGVAVSLSVEGALVRPAALTVKELEALGPATVEFKDKKGAHTGIGVRLDKLLLHLGFSEGRSGPKVDPKQKHAGLRSVVIATARDGFEAVFSVGELLETLGSTRATIVWQMDGKPLPDNVGPFRIVVANDKLPSRSIYQVTSLKVVDLSTGTDK